MFVILLVNNMETPLHKACQTGNLQLVYDLIQKGAQVDVRDCNNKSAVHHAFKSIYILHYLTKFCGANLNAIDKDLQTPLHYACREQNEDTVKYLIKQGCSLVQADKYGDTALHLCALESNGQLFWDIVHAGGLSLLFLSNKYGETPLDIARNGNKPMHRQIVNTFQFALNMSDVNYKYRPYISTTVIFWYSCRHQLYYLTALLLASWLTPDTQGCVVFPGAILMLIRVYTDGHRIEHISQLPNPVKAGALGVGMFLSVVHFFTVIVPILLNTGSVLPVFSIILLPVLLCVYIKLWKSNPGIVKYSVLKPDGSKNYDLQDLLEISQKPEAMCRFCLIIPKQPTKHCRLCNCCIYNMDHHCQYINMCVGVSNRRLFVLFIIILLMSMSCYILGAFVYIKTLLPGLTYWELLRETFLYHAGLLTLALFNTMFSILLVFMAVAQISLISKGYTYVFQPHKSLHICNLSTVQKLFNVWNFVVGNRQFVHGPLCVNTNTV